MWKLSLAHWPEYLCEAGLVALFVLADCLITYRGEVSGVTGAQLVPGPAWTARGHRARTWYGHALAHQIGAR